MIEKMERVSNQRKLVDSARQIEEEICNLPSPDWRQETRIGQDCCDKKIQD